MAQRSSSSAAAVAPVIVGLVMPRPTGERRHMQLVKLPSAAVVIANPAPPQVRYMARKLKAVSALAPRDKEVWTAAWKARKTGGISRRQLMEALHTHSTGTVDGALRRLRLKKLVVAKTV